MRHAPWQRRQDRLGADAHGDAARGVARGVEPPACVGMGDAATRGLLSRARHRDVAEQARINQARINRRRDIAGTKSRLPGRCSTEHHGAPSESPIADGGQAASSATEAIATASARAGLASADPRSALRAKRPGQGCRLGSRTGSSRRFSTLDGQATIAARSATESKMFSEMCLWYDNEYSIPHKHEKLNRDRK